MRQKAVHVSRRRVSKKWRIARSKLAKIVSCGNPIFKLSLLESGRAAATVNRGILRSTVRPICLARATPLRGCI